MNGHAASKESLSDEESMGFLEEKCLSDMESEAEQVHIETHFTQAQKRRHNWISKADVLASLVLRPVSSWRTHIIRTVIFLLPSFVQARFFSHDPRIRSSGGGDPPSLTSPSPTAYLDGMRGFAAFFVFCCHYSYTCFDIQRGWGYGQHNYHILRLPIIRLFYQGPPMVCVFFVISGYALSMKPLRLISSRRADSFAATMTSFVFRRGIRLFVPTAISTLMIVLLIRIGLYEWTRDFAHDPQYLRYVQEIHYRRFDTTAEQLADWARAMFNFVHIWSWEKFGGSTTIDVHLWTIPVEFRSSMMLFLTLIGTARLRTKLRFLFVSGLVCFAYGSDRWDMMLFYLGMLLAEWDLVRGAHAHNSSPPPSRQSTTTTGLCWHFLSILALYLMSQPDVGSESTPGWIFLTSLIPDWWSDKYRYWQCFGAALFVLCVGHCPSSWQRFFTTPFARYLGNISYAIYLMHGPALHTVGYATQRWAWGLTGVYEDKVYNWGFVLASVFVVPVVVWAADVFWRAVDAPVVRFAKWLEGKCSVVD